MHDLHIARITEPTGIGSRILVDRLWPRGIKKDAPLWDEWMPDVAPSTALRKAYHAGEMDFAAFSAAYDRELEANAAVDRLLARWAAGPLWLLSYVKRIDRSHLPVLAHFLTRVTNER
ncbi:MAG: DUF488 family protein [Firmicutes bacterium]|nr:DUF488 family protein [Bacillota bacterium]